MSAPQLDVVAFLQRHKLAKSHRLQPLFEAIENAFQAIEERVAKDGECAGQVEIIVHRRRDQAMISLRGGSDRGAPLIEGFTVRDNGIGFGEDQWLAFNRYYTGHKLNRGGKGVGRYSYLQAFREARFESRFQQDEKIWRRAFKLVPAADPAPHEPPSLLTEEDLNGSPLGTEVVLDGYTSAFAEIGPKRLEALASHIGEHFFRRLIGSDGTTCVLRDEGGNAIDLRDHVASQIIHQQESFVTLLGQKFSVTHYRCKQRVGSRHEILFCGDGRVVRSEPTPPCLFSSRNPLKSDAGEFYYVAYVESPFLNERVEDHRLGFSITERGDDLFSSDEPSMEAIVDAVAAAAKEYLKDSLHSVMAKHERRIFKVCKSDPILTPLIESRREEMLSLPVDLNDDQLRARIRGIYHEWKDEVRGRFAKLNAKVRDNLESAEEYRERYRKSLKELNHLAKAELAGYVTDRKAVIDFLWDRMARNNGKFADEDALHDVFFPRKTDSNCIAWDESNLWLIDERLAFSTYIASELAFSSHTSTPVKSLKRPDIAAYVRHRDDPDYVVNGHLVGSEQVFDDSYVFSDQELPECNSLCIVEFKRPGREKFEEGDNPIDQVRRYIRLIRAHEAETSSGHVIRLPESAPIWVYIVCHLAGNLERFMDNFIKLPDGQGYISYWSGQNATVQVVTPEKLIADARKRHKAFFQKLGIDRC